MCPSLMKKLFVIKQGHFFFVIYHKGFCFFKHVVCQNVLWLIKEEMDILQHRPRLKTRLAEIGDTANDSKRLSFLS